MEELIKSKIREISDWPEKGVSFKDITPLIEDKEAFRKVIDVLASSYSDEKIDKVIGIDARGFLLAAPLAYKLNAGLAIIRKKGKLPFRTIFQKYDLEYGTNTLEIHEDSILSGEKVLLVDDVLATGGTIRAAVDLVNKLGGDIVGIDFLIELDYLEGREKIKEQKIRSLANYQSEQKPLDVQAMIGLIGGTGFYDFLEGGREIEVETEYGKPSDKIIIATLFGKNIAFLPRHGKKHHLPPHKIPYQANIAAFRKLGVEQIIAPSAVGSLKPEIKPGHFVVCDQFIDRTKNRQDTFYNGPKVAHISLAHPYCTELRNIAIEHANRLDLNIHSKGTVVVIEGPKFSTLSESMYYSKIGADLINMTQFPENALAAEMGMCYLNISLVTDYDAGIYSQGIEPVSIEQVLTNFKNNTEKLKQLVSLVIRDMPKRTCNCKKRAEQAII